MNFKYLAVTALLLFALASCKNNYHEKQQAEQIMRKEYNKKLIEANKGLVARDSSRIVGVIRANNWDMNVTGTGLWYEIIEKGRGQKAKPNQIAILDYKVRLLSGELAYTSDSTGPLKFKISKGGVERGLEEGILLLHQGDSARFIMPPYMAHHLLGDQKKIPPRSTIIYEVRLKSLKK